MSARESLFHLSLTQRELQLVRQALELGRDQSVNPQWRWWHETQYADGLYRRVRALWQESRNA